MLMMTGRSAFPLAALEHCHPRDETDFHAIKRSQILGDHFHGVVALERVTREGHRMLDLAGWTEYVPPPKHKRLYKPKG